MESTKKLTFDTVKKMSLVELQAINQNGLSAPVKQAINVRIAHLSTPEASEAPVETVQETIASDAVSAPVAEVAKKQKNKPNETTYTITAFDDDTKGIRAGSMVTFLENNKPGAKLLTGKVQRLFNFYAKHRQEAKIMVEVSPKSFTRYYRFEKDMQPVVAAVVEEAPVAEVAEAAAE